MSNDRRFKFTHSVTSSGFSKALSQRVDDYFLSRGISKRANAEMVLKTVLGVASWIGIYVWLLTGNFAPLEVVAMYVILGFAELFMGLNIAHDANHGAYSKSRLVNRVLGYVFDLVGMSSYMWRLFHNDAHHYFVNVRGADTALVTGRIFRFSPYDKRLSFHRYQHLYAPFFYCLPTLDWVLTKDYRWLCQKRFGNRQIVKHPVDELVMLFVGKGFYYTYMLVLPLIFLPTPWYYIIFGFLLMHLSLGLALALTFQPNHFTDSSSCPEADERGYISNNYIQHILDNTADYARRNPLANWFLGGLNLHIVHHMFPGICHVHYPALTKIIMTTAQEYGLCYRENRTISGAFLAHLKWLKALGRADADIPS